MGMYNAIVKYFSDVANKRANFSIDGFNLYFGIVRAGYSHCKWLDIEKLATALINSTHSLNRVKYFTSRINNNPEKQHIRKTYLSALMTTKTEIIFGEFRTNRVRCQGCGSGWYDSKEKKTDVSIAL